MTTSKAPRGLGTAGRRLWTVVLAEYDLSGPELRVLDLACQAADRSEQARAEIDALGITVTDRYGGPRLHPAVPVERDARAAVLAGLRALGVVNPTDALVRTGSTPGPKPKGRR